METAIVRSKYWDDTARELDAMEDVFILDFIEVSNHAWSYIQAYADTIGSIPNGFMFPDHIINYLHGIIREYMETMYSLGQLHMRREYPEQGDSKFATSPQPRPDGSISDMSLNAAHAAARNIADKVVKAANEPGANLVNLRGVFNNSVSTSAAATGRYQGMIAYNDGRLSVLSNAVGQIVGVLDGSICSYCYSMHGHLVQLDDGILREVPIEGYRSFDGNDTEEMSKWGQEHFGKWNWDVSSEERFYLQHYQVDGYLRVNKDLRAGKLDQPGTRGVFPYIDRAIAKGRIPENVILYRGASGLSNIRVGSVITDKGFLSTTLSKNKGEYFLRLGQKTTTIRTGVEPEGYFFEIRVPKGTPAAYMPMVTDGGGLSGTGVYRGEQEVLLPRNTSLRVLSIEKDVKPETLTSPGDGGVRYNRVIAEVIPEKEAKLSAEFALGSLPLPPYHVSCRCTVTVLVSDESVIDDVANIGDYGIINSKDSFDVQLHKAQQDVKRLPFERAYAWNDKLKIKFTKDGDASSIAFDPTELEVIKGGVFIHNHPKGTSFSLDDINVAAKFDLKEMQAVGIDDTFIMKRPLNGWNMADIRIEYYATHADVMIETRAQLERGEISLGVANKRHFHTVWERVAETLHIPYVKVPTVSDDSSEWDKLPRINVNDRRE